MKLKRFSHPGLPARQQSIFLFGHKSRRRSLELGSNEILPGPWGPGSWLSMWSSSWVRLYWVICSFLGASGNQPSEALKATQKTKRSVDTGVYSKFSSLGLHIFREDRKLTFNWILAWKTLRQASVKYSVKACPFDEKTVITFGQNFSNYDSSKERIKLKCLFLALRLNFNFSP